MCACVFSQALGAAPARLRGSWHHGRPGIRTGHPAGRNRTGSSREGHTPGAVRDQQGRTPDRQAGSSPRWRTARPASLLRERLLWRRLHARRRVYAHAEHLQHDRRPWQLHDRRLQARRGRVRRTAPLQAPRPALDRSAAGAKRRRSASTAWEPRRRRTTARTTASSNPTRRPSSRSRPTRRTWLLRGGLEFAKWSQQPGSRNLPVGRDRLHALDPARPGCRADVYPRAGHVRLRLAHRSGVRAARRLPRRHGARLHRP